MYAIYIERHTNVMWNLRVSPCFQPSLVCLTLRAPGNYTHSRAMREFHAQNASKKLKKNNLSCIHMLQELSPFLLFFSYFRSWPMKFKLGEMTGLRSLTNLYASPRQRPCRFMMYATVTVAERDTPAWQCTRTPLPCSRASSTEEESRIR